MSWVNLGEISGAKLWGRQGPFAGMLQFRSCLHQLRDFGDHFLPLSLISKLPLSFAVPILCSYLFWERLTAAPSASSAKGLCSLCQGCVNQMESQ